MKAKVILCILFLSCISYQLWANDTIRYEALKLQKIKVDTLTFIETDKFLGCYNLTFISENNSEIKASFINIGSLKNKAAVYAWENKASAKNFTLELGLYYKMYLETVCWNDLEPDSYYFKNADFSYDKCSLSKVFNTSKYKNDFYITKTHYLHKEASVYKVLYFAQTSLSGGENSKGGVGFLPLKLKYDH